MVAAITHNLEIAPQRKFSYKVYAVQAALVRRILLFCETNFALSYKIRYIQAARIERYTLKLSIILLDYENLNYCLTYRSLNSIQAVR